MGADPPAARHMQQSAALCGPWTELRSGTAGPSLIVRVVCVRSLVVDPQRVGLQREVLHVGRLLLGKQDHHSQVGQVELLVEQAPPGQVHAQVLEVHVHLRGRRAHGLCRVSQHTLSPAEVACIAADLGWGVAQVHQVRVHLQRKTATIISLAGAASLGAEEHQIHTELQMQSLHQSRYTTEPSPGFQRPLSN